MWSRFLHISVIILACACTSNRQEEPNRVSFYFSAHPDDWQLFMGEKAWEDIQDPKTKVVFILTTAGDAAMGMGSSATSNVPYYKAREQGYINAIQWAESGVIEVDKNGKSVLPIGDYEIKDQWFSLQPLRTFSGEKANSYLFMLPDGFPNGEYQWSLQKLKEGKIPYIPSIDSVNLYNSWNDLRKIVELIIESETGDLEEIVMNLAERDTVLNPGDHSDHWHTSLLGEEAALELNKSLKRDVTYRYYREHHISNLEANLEAEQVQIKKFLFSANAKSKEEAGYDSPWDEYHMSLASRSYYREVKQD